MPSQTNPTLRLHWSDYEIPAGLPAPLIGDPTLPLVTVVTPSYNQGQFIGETIESVLQQDYPNIEYWVIDGGSTDSTIEVLRRYEGDPRFHWLSERDKGQGDAVNKGWRRSQGEVLGWLNSDDTYCRGAIRAQAQYLHTHHDADIVYGDALFIDAHGNQIGKYWARAFSLSEQLRTSCIPQPTAFLRRACMLRNGPIDVSLWFTLDYEYWLRAASHSKLIYVPGEIATYRMHTSSKTVAGADKSNSELQTILERYLAADGLAVSAGLMQEQDAVYADVYAAMGMNCVKCADRKGAMSYLKRSLARRPRPRALLLLAFMLDPTPSFQLATKANEAWSLLRSRRSLRLKTAKA